MSSRSLIGCVWALTLTGLLLGSSDVTAQTMADYTAIPPFVSETVPPNILMLLDNSGSMNSMAYDDSGEAFDPTKSHTGIFDATDCYQYDGAADKFVPDPAANQATMPAGGWTCTGNSTYEWSGNLLNYGTMRRIDIAKSVMVGGVCAVTRDADLTCSSVKGQDAPFAACCQNQAQRISTANVTGRMAAAFIPSGSYVYFQLEGSNSNLRGKFCVDDDASTPSSFASSCQDGGSFTEGEFVIRADQLTNSTGVIQQVGDKARFGMMEFSTLGDDGGVIQAGVGTDLANMVSAIEGTRPETWTPLAESLYEASRYFAQIQPAYNSGDYTYTVSTEDPYYFVSPRWAGTDQTAPCCQSFAIIFTDGESTQDGNIPSGLQDFAHAVHGSHCTGVGCSGHRTNYPSNGRHYLDDVAYWAHTTDLRQATIPVIGATGKDLLGIQSLTVYSFYAFGNANARELLHSTAKAGAFIDKNGNNLPDATGQTCTYPAGSPLGSGTSTSSAEWDTDKDCVADAYFESSNADDLRDRLMAAITSILQRSSSGSAASVLASSSTGDGALYQSFFFPSTFEGLNEIKWTGYSQALFLDTFGNLREDSNRDGKLIYEEDKIIRINFDPGTTTVVVERYADTNGSGVAGALLGKVGLKDVIGIWEAGEELAKMSPSVRKLHTWVDKDNDGLVDSGEQIEFTAANAGDLAPYLRPDAAPFTTDNIINFIRGESITGMRDRRLTVGGSLQVWKLGDAIHAQPLVVGAPAQRYGVIYGDSSYTDFFQRYHNRRQVAYVGANDGMLHAFNAGFYHRGNDPATSKTEHGWFTRTPTDNSGGPLLGEELWGFIPQELLPHLEWLTQPDYTHVYYVDLTPKVTDARVFTPDADHPNGWGTILMGGFRMGGSCGACVAGTGAPPMTVTADFNADGDTADPDDTRTFYSAYFVLDITNPEVDPVLLWSFSTADLGLTTTVPSMLRVSTNTDVTDNDAAKWYMVMGSGPTGYDAGITQSGNLYAMDLGPGGTGTVVTLPAELLHAFMGNTVMVDRNFDYRVDVGYMGSTIDDGALPWRGKLYRLTTNCGLTDASAPAGATPCSSPNTWGVGDAGARAPTEILDTFPSGGNLELGPVAAAPAVTIDDSNKLWVFAGTGRYYDTMDKTSTEQQYFVGVKDNVLNDGCDESTRTNCHVDDLVDLSGAQVCLVGVGICGSGTDQVTGVTGATDFRSLIALVAGQGGWYTTLPDPGERALARPLVFAGLVFFPTFTPTNDVCAATGESRLYALFYLTGSAYSASTVGTDPGSGGVEYVKRSTSLGQGLATEVAVHIGAGGRFGRAGVLSKSSTSQIFQLAFTTRVAITGRLVSWNLERR